MTTERLATGERAVAVDRLIVDRGGRRVLDGLSFSVQRGSVTGLLGPSASGKTTLIRAIVGVQIVASGRVTVFGAAAGDAALRSRVGYVTQAPAVYHDLTVRENLRYFAAVLDAPATDIERVLGDVALTDRAESVVGALSGGQVARVSLATALLGRPELLVLDEPTVGLDPVLRRDLWDLFSVLAGRGVTLLVSSHVMDEARRCNRLLLLREGRILADDPPATILARTRAPDLDEAFLKLVEGEA